MCKAPFLPERPIAPRTVAAEKGRITLFQYRIPADAKKAGSRNVPHARHEIGSAF